MKNLLTVSQLNFVNMAFRHHHFVTRISYVGRDVEQPILEHDGNGFLSLVNRSVNEVNRGMPEPSDYTLEKLLNSNVPLHPVGVTLDNDPSESNIEEFVNNKLKIENNNED